MTNLELAKKQIKIHSLKSNVTLLGDVYLIDSYWAYNAVELAATTDWKYPEKNEFPDFDGMILAFSKSKQIVKPIFYRNDNGTKSWLKLNFEAWCELPIFNNY